MDLEKLKLVSTAIGFALVSMFFGLLAVLVAIDALSCSGAEKLLRLMLAAICGAGSAIAVAAVATVLEDL